MQQHDDEIAEPEGESVSVVRLRHGERDHEEPTHSSDKQQPKRGRSVAIAFVSHA